VRTTKTQTDDNDGDVAPNGEYPTRKVPLRHYSMTPQRSAVDRQKVEKKIYEDQFVVYSRAGVGLPVGGGRQRQGQSRQ